MPASQEEPSDAALVARCRAGEEAAWQLLVRRYERLVYTVPRRARLPAELAGDVFQATFSRLFEHLDSLQDPTRVRAWLVTTARRETLRVLELQRRSGALPAHPHEADARSGTPDDIADPGPLPDEQLQALQVQDLVRRAVDRLDERSRRFVELFFLQDEPLPYTEIAARLGIAVGSIGPTRARCLAKLRELLPPSGTP